MSASMLFEEQPPTGGAMQQYSRYAGDYSQVDLVAGLNIERFGNDRIAAALAATDELVVSLDAGAAGSISAMRTAQRFKDEIAAGRLAVVVSNLASPRLDYLNTLDPTEYRANALALYEETQGDIHEIFTDFTPGQMHTITVAGQEVDLRGRVNHLHERYALTYWGSEPGTIIALGELLAPNGLYMVQAYDVGIMQKKVGPAPYTLVMGFFRRRGFEFIRDMRTETGELVPAQYFMFRGPEAPPPELPPGHFSQFSD